MLARAICDPHLQSENTTLSPLKCVGSQLLPDSDLVGERLRMQEVCLWVFCLFLFLCVLFSH